MPNESALTIDVPQLRSAVDDLLNAPSRIASVRGWRSTPTTTGSLNCGQHSARTCTSRADLGVGQISDDIASVAEVVQVLKELEIRPILWHDLEHVTGVLRALAWMDLSKDS
jgi:hypothetical protein